MKNIQYIIWSDLKNSVGIDTLLWKFPLRLLESFNLKDKQCQLLNVLALEWEEGEAVPVEEWKPWLNSNSIQGFKDLAPEFGLECRSKNTSANELPTLLLSCFRASGFKLPKNIYQSTLIDLSSAQTENNLVWEQVLESLKRRSLINSIWDPANEEVRIIRGPKYDFWSNGAAENIPWEEGQGILKDEFLKGELSPLKKTHFLVEHSLNDDAEKPRLIQNQLTADLWSNLFGSEFKSQADFLLMRSKKSKAKNLPGFAPKQIISKSLALTSKPFGFFVEIDTPCVFPKTECMSSLPVSSQRIKTLKNGDHLFFVGPWNSRNKTMEQSIEGWLRIRPDLLIRSVLWDASDNWVYALLDLVFPASGWRFDKNALMGLLKAAKLKSTSDNFLVFWGDLNSFKLFKDDPLPAGLKYGIMGSSDREGVYQIEGAASSDIALSAFRSQWEAGLKKNQLAISVQTVERKQQIVKSASYGYDRATAFPDQYTLKAHVAARSHALSWIESEWIYRTGSKILSTTMGTFLNIPLNSKRIISQDQLKVVVSQRVRNLWIHNPALAARILIDDALRSMLAQGASLKRLGANLWMGYGRRLSPSTQAAISLFFESLKLGLKEINLPLDSLKVNPMTSNEGMDAVLFLHSQDSLLDPPEIFHGLRMEEETIFSVGPRPFQMEAGSSVLKFVRVFSNYVTSVELEHQLNLYQLLEDLCRKGTISSIYPIKEGGVAGAIFNMALWGGRGAMFRPGLSAFELFSAAPGRVLVGVLPQDVRYFESRFKGEQILSIATVKGDRLWGRKLSEMTKEVSDYEEDHFA